MKILYIAFVAVSFAAVLDTFETAYKDGKSDVVTTHLLTCIRHAVESGNVKVAELFFGSSLFRHEIVENRLFSVAVQRDDINMIQHLRRDSVVQRNLYTNNEFRAGALREAKSKEAARAISNQPDTRKLLGEACFHGLINIVLMFADELHYDNYGIKRKSKSNKAHYNEDSGLLLYKGTRLDTPQYDLVNFIDTACLAKQFDLLAWFLQTDNVYFSRRTSTQKLFIFERLIRRYFRKSDRTVFRMILGKLFWAFCHDPDLTETAMTIPISGFENVFKFSRIFLSLNGLQKDLPFDVIGMIVSLSVELYEN